MRAAAAIAALLTLACAPVAAQTPRLLGVVRAPDGAALADARIRAFALPAVDAPWLDRAVVAPLELRTNDRGRFGAPLAARAALWIDADGRSAFVTEAAPGVPVVAATAPAAIVELPAGARGAWLRLAGVPVGFLAGSTLRLPAVAAELLVAAAKGDARDFTAAFELQPDDRVRARAPSARSSRLSGLPAGAFAVLDAWPDRRIAADADGTLTLPALAKPALVRVHAASDRERMREELWVAPDGGDVRVDLSTAWRALRVTGPDGAPIAGASVRTVRSGPGTPTTTSTSTSDRDGVARYREATGWDRVVVVADGFAVTSALPVDLAAGDDVVEVRLEPAHALRLRVCGEHGVPLAGALVTVGIAPETRRSLRTDGRGGVVLAQLPRGEVAMAIEHPDYAPLRCDVDVPSEQLREYALERGASIRGRVECAERIDMADVLVEVRGARDALLRRPQRVTAASDGTFVLRGLTATPVDLFAHRVERGTTWSGASRGAVPGGAPVTITIRCDDPQPDR